MASTTFTLNEFTGNDIQTNVTLTEVNGTIKADVSVANGFIGDLRGVFFHIGNESLISSLRITGANVTSTKLGPANGVEEVGNAVISPGIFDFGVEIGTDGIGKDDIRSTTFIISSTSRSLTLADFINANTQGPDMGVRITSVGSNRSGSSKLDGEVPGNNTPPANPGIDIVKVTNGGDGLTILEGSDVTWTYSVRNTGNVGLSNISVTDNKEGSITNLTGGDTDNDNILDVGETWTYKETGTAKADKYENIGTVTGRYNTQNVTASDPSSYFGADPGINIDKVTNGGDGQTILAGSAITWTYTVTNTGNVGLSNISVTDNEEGSVTNLTGGDTDNDNVLDVGETWIYKETGTAKAGNYSNTGTVTGGFTDGLGTTETVRDNDPSSYFGANPSINIDKVTNGGDGQTILAGSPITWTYTVTNTGNVGLSNVSVSDDKEGSVTNLTGGDSDNDNILDVGETWTYEESGTAKAGNYNNTGTVTGGFTDDLGNTKPVTDNDPSSYFGANPSINIDKVTDNFSVQGDGLLIQQGNPVGWIYTVTNTGNVGLSNVAVTDDKGVTPVYVSGDSNQNSTLDLTESWVYKASGTATLGAYQNLGTATGSFTDSLGVTEKVNDSDLSSYTGVKSAGARTPGFWQRWTAVWDGNATNDSTFQGRADFPMSDLLLAPYSNSPQAPKVLDPVTGQYTTGILVGDYNRNGMTDGSEKTFFYSVTEAQNIVNSSAKVQQDVRYTLDRSLVASWLNFLTGQNAPTQSMNNAISWLQAYTPDETGDGKGDGNLVLNASSRAIPASSSAWSNSSDTHNGLPTGESINAALDYYNNTGMFGSQPV